MKLECSRCGQPFEDYQTAEMEIHAKNRHSRQGQASDNLDFGPVEWVPVGTHKSMYENAPIGPDPNYPYGLGLDPISNYDRWAGNIVQPDTIDAQPDLETHKDMWNTDDAGNTYHWKRNNGETDWGQFTKDFFSLDKAGLDVHDLLELQQKDSKEHDSLCPYCGQQIDDDGMWFEHIERHRSESDRIKGLNEVDAGDWKGMTMEDRRIVLIDAGFDEYIRFNSNKDFADLHPMIKYKLSKESRLEQEESEALEYKKLLE